MPKLALLGALLFFDAPVFAQPGLIQNPARNSLERLQ